MTSGWRVLGTTSCIAQGLFLYLYSLGTQGILRINEVVWGLPYLLRLSCKASALVLVLSFKPHYFVILLIFVLMLYKLTQAKLLASVWIKVVVCVILSFTSNHRISVLSDTGETNHLKPLTLKESMNEMGLADIYKAFYLPQIKYSFPPIHIELWDKPHAESQNSPWNQEDRNDIDYSLGPWCVWSGN